MSNYHLRDKELSLKAKGLLSLILSLPENWDYSVRGLAAISHECVDSISTILKELEQHGYLERKQQRNNGGRMGKMEYVIYEQPKPPPDSPCTEKPDTVKADTGTPDTDLPDEETPCTETPAQLSKDKLNTEGLNTDVNNYPFNQFCETPEEIAERMRREREAYREIIHENIDYDYLMQERHYRGDVDELVEIILDTVCSTKPFIRIQKEDMPKEVVKSRFLKLDSEHIKFVLDCMRENTTKVRNIKQYLLAALYNAPITIGNYYTALVNHDLYGGGG
jgi:hypothetical protein